MAMAHAPDRANFGPAYPGGYVERGSLFQMVAQGIGISIAGQSAARY